MRDKCINNNLANKQKPREHTRLQMPARDGLAATVDDDRSTVRAGDRVLLIIEDDVRFAHILLGMARDRGYIRLGLETGSGPAFQPALALYRGFGFKDGEIFGDYRPDPFLHFMHLDL